MKSSLYVRQNDKEHAHQITLLSLAPKWEPFSSIYIYYVVGMTEYDCLMSN